MCQIATARTPLKMDTVFQVLECEVCTEFLSPFFGSNLSNKQLFPTLSTNNYRKVSRTFACTFFLFLSFTTLLLK